MYADKKLVVPCCIYNTILKKTVFVDSYDEVEKGYNVFKGCNNTLLFIKDEEGSISGLYEYVKSRLQI